MGEIVSACYIDMNGFCSHVDSSDRLDLYPCQRKLRQVTGFPARQDTVFPKDKGWFGEDRSQRQGSGLL